MVSVPGEVLTPILGGILGFVCSRIEGTTHRRAIWLVASVLGGMLVSALNAEFPRSPEFLFFDVPMVAGIALLTSFSLRNLRARPRGIVDRGWTLLSHRRS